MVILIALMIDWLFGEPPLWAHPVVWFGNYFKQTERSRGLTNPLFWGGFWFLLGGILVVSLAWLLQLGLAKLPYWWVTIGLTGILLKPAFAFRLLVQEVAAIEAALQVDLNAGRQRLAYIVSRPTAELSAAQVRESALESMSENLSDSVIAPLFWFVLFGLPGAYLYRFVNTADAMWGYRTEQYEQWGKIAARSDDLLNWIPARITGLLLLYFPFRDAKTAPVSILLKEAQKTPSPNSGWSMAALAMRLGVRLGKPEVYTLNPTAPVPESIDVSRAINLVTQVGWVSVIILSFIVGRRDGI
jgi:adenosylcobinamide-phosphate synthase